MDNAFAAALPQAAAGSALIQPEICVLCTHFISERAVILPCNHAFDVGCIHTWMLGGHGTCPLCHAGIDYLRHGPGLGRLIQVHDQLQEVEAAQLRKLLRQADYECSHLMAIHAEFQRNRSAAEPVLRGLPGPLVHLLFGWWGHEAEFILNFGVPDEVRNLVYRGNTDVFWLVLAHYEPLLRTPNIQAHGHYNGFRVGDLRFRSFHPGFTKWRTFIFYPMSPGPRAQQVVNDSLLGTLMRKESQMYDEERSLVYRNALYASYPTSLLSEQTIIGAGLGGVYPWDHEPGTLASSPALRYFAYLFASREVRTLWYPHQSEKPEKSAASFNRIGWYIVDEFACRTNSHLFSEDEERELAGIMGSVDVVRHFFHELRCFLASFLHARFDPDSLGSYSYIPWGRNQDLGGPGADEDYRRANMLPPHL